MRIGTVIGNVILSTFHPSYRGGRLLVTLPWSAQHLKHPLHHDPAIVVFDQLGAATGQQIAISEGREAACPFPNPTPVDAYCSCLLDQIIHKPSPIPPPTTKPTQPNRKTLDTP